MKPLNRIPRSNAAWRKFLVKSKLASEKEIAAQKEGELKRMLEHFRKKESDRPKEGGSDSSDENGSVG